MAYTVMAYIGMACAPSIHSGIWPQSRGTPSSDLMRHATRVARPVDRMEHSKEHWMEHSKEHWIKHSKEHWIEDPKEHSVEHLKEHCMDVEHSKEHGMEIEHSKEHWMEVEHSTRDLTGDVDRRLWRGGWHWLDGRIVHRTLRNTPFGLVGIDVFWAAGAFTAPRKKKTPHSTSTWGIYAYGLHSYGLYSHGLRSYGLCSYDKRVGFIYDRQRPCVSVRSDYWCRSQADNYRSVHLRFQRILPDVGSSS